MNRIVLVGRLESTPELRFTSTGIPVANFSLSVRRSIPNGQGRYERDIFRIVTWRKLAETCCKFLERGRMIAVDGKLQNRIMSNSNGERRIIVEIHADDVRFLEGARPRSEEPGEYYGDSQEQEGSQKVTEPVPAAEGTRVQTETPAIETAEVNSGEVVGPAEDDGNWLLDEDAGTPLDLSS